MRLNAGKRAAEWVDALDPKVYERVLEAVQDETLKKEERDRRVFEALANDPTLDDVGWIERYFKIRDKRAEIVSFKHNQPQRLLDEIVARQEGSGLPVMLIVLKARQEGVTTWSCGRIAAKCLRKPHRYGMVIAHKGDASKKIFETTKRFVEMMPVQPDQAFSNRREVVLAEPQGSQMVIETAELKDAGRSMTMNYLHCSEVAFWPDASQTMLGLLQVLPSHPDVWCVIESTANGVGNWFHATWTRAKEGKNNFIPVFLPWFMLDSYKIALNYPEEGAEIMKSLDDEEQRLVTLFELKPEQLKWRRWCIENKCEGDIGMFHQEYPATDDEAFLSSGRPVFNLEIVKNMMAQAPLPIAAGRLAQEIR